jgi:ABC-2 type transport system ATP-binding protein
MATSMPGADGGNWRFSDGAAASARGVQETDADAVESSRSALDHFAGYHARPRSTGELLAAVGLGESAGVRVERLSGGRRRRLAVALGVHGGPDLLFLDEPTTGMDPVAGRGSGI